MYMTSISCVLKVWFFLEKLCAWIISSGQTISNANTLLKISKKVYGVGITYPTIFRENGILWNSHFRPKFSKSWIYQIANVKYWFIKDLTNDASAMLWNDN